MARAYTSTAMSGRSRRAVVELCENPQSHSAQWPGAELIRARRLRLWLGPPIYPGLTCVLNVQASDARAVLDEARDVLRDRGRDACELDDRLVVHAVRSLPDDLLALGLVDDIDPVLRGLVASREPDGVDQDRSSSAARQTRDDMHAFFRDPAGGVR